MGEVHLALIADLFLVEFSFQRKNNVNQGICPTSESGQGKTIVLFFSIMVDYMICSHFQNDFYLGKSLLTHHADRGSK